MKRLFSQLSTETLAARMGWVMLFACALFLYLTFFGAC